MVNLIDQCRKLLKSFGYAFRGIVFCLKNERNFRIHLSVGLDVLLYSLLCELTNIEFALLFLTIGLVLAAEGLNTAIEKTVDLASPEIHPLAKIAKDTAAGSVLLLALAAIAVGVALFYPFAELKTIFTSPILLLLALVLAVGELFFIFYINPKTTDTE